MKGNPTPWWYLAKAIRSKSFFDLTTVLSIVGLTLGVASLVVSMAVFSGYVQTLKSSVQNLFGHIVIFNRGMGPSSAFEEKMRSSKVPIQARTSFLSVESVLAHKGAMSGVMIEGVDTSTLESVISIRGHLIEGEFLLSPDEPLAVIGKGVATKFGLKVGDQFRVVTPQSVGLDALQLKPKVLKMTVSGILNFGRYDFDSRYILTNIKVAQDYNGRGKQISGMRVRIDDPEEAEAMARVLAAELGDRFWVRDWSEINKTLFEAVGLEKAVIFFLLLILILVACFNLSSQLIVGVVRRYQDIAILKT
ncbi:MAG: hypothetical protein GW917_03400, partial [Bdellovibrionales bacterium]|nr:hypothetical protein [Bdellovibrionales bacterium]